MFRTDIFRKLTLGAPDIERGKASLPVKVRGSKTPFLKLPNFFGKKARYHIFVMKGNTKRTSGNSFSQSEAQNKDLGAASQTLLTEVQLRLRYRIVAE